MVEALVRTYWGLANGGKIREIFFEGIDMIENAITLRPLRLVELLDAAFRIYRRNFLTFVGIMAIMQIPLSLLTLGSSLVSFRGLDSLSGAGMPDLQYFLGTGGTILVGILSFFMVRGFATAALTRTIAASSLGGRLGVIESYRKIGSSAGNLLLSLLLSVLILIGMLIWLLIPCIGWFSGLGMTYYFSFVVIQLLVPVIVLEKRGPMDALRRAWELARRRFWWLLGLAAVLYLLNLVLLGPAALVNYLIAFIFQRSVTSSMDFMTTGSISAISNALMTMLVTLIYYPLQLSVIVLAYFDLRVRNEGFDLSMQSINSAEYPDPVDAIAAAPAVPQQASILTRMEFGYFVAGTLGAMLLFVVVYGALALVGVGLSSFFMGRGL